MALLIPFMQAQAFVSERLLHEKLGWEDERIQRALVNVINFYSRYELPIISQQEICQEFSTGASCSHSSLNRCPECNGAVCCVLLRLFKS